MADLELQQPPYGQGGATNKGYQPLVSEDPPRYQPPQQPVTGYPATLSQQGTNTAVVVTQPTVNPQPTTIQVNVRSRAKEHFIFTVVLMAICCCLGYPTAFLCLCPAFIFASLAFHQNNVGDRENAKSLGIAALTCNIMSIVIHVLIVTGLGITILALALTSSSRTEGGDDYDGDDCYNRYNYEEQRYETVCY